MAMVHVFHCLKSVIFAQVMLYARYGGVVVRDAVRAGADWFVNDFEDLSQALERHQVAFIGSGEHQFLPLCRSCFWSS